MNQNIMRLHPKENNRIGVNSCGIHEPFAGERHTEMTATIRHLVETLSQANEYNRILRKDNNDQNHELGKLRYELDCAHRALINAGELLETALRSGPPEEFQVAVRAWAESTPWRIEFELTPEEKPLTEEESPSTPAAEEGDDKKPTEVGSCIEYGRNLVNDRYV